jgi:hypothetical protein
MVEVHAGVHSREARSRAREIKFVVNNDLAPKIQAWMRENLEADQFGTGPDRDVYETTSLYFETDRFDVFHRRGSYGKSKFRIRKYGDSSIMFLERKFRTDRVLIKRRTTVPVTDFERLDSLEPDPAWPGYWFHRRLRTRALRPLVQVCYNRTARLGTSSTGQFRMTVDFDLRVLPLPDRAFIPGVGLPLMEGLNIVELKYCVALPAVFKQLVERFGLETQPVSKYRSGLALLGLSPEPAHV